MTLIEIVIVIAIIATLASVAIPTLITSLDVQDNKTTKASMEALKTAMLNYYRDVGMMPKLKPEQKDWASSKWGIKEFGDLDALVYNPFNPDSPDIKEFIAGKNWNGPYILSSFNRDDYKYDAWGRPFFYDPDYGTPEYMLGTALGAFGQETSSAHGGAGETSTNGVLLVSQGKVKGFGRSKMDTGADYQGWYGVLTWEKIKGLSLSQVMNPESDDDYIPIVIDPRAERVAGAHGSYDDEKIDSTKQLLEELKGAVVDFVYDLGVVPPYEQSGVGSEARVPLDSGYFSQFPNPLLMLAEYFIDDPQGAASGGKVKDRIPQYKTGHCYSFNDSKDGVYANMGWKGPYFLTRGMKIDNGTIPEFDITYEDFIDSWGNALKVPFAGDDLWQDFGAAFDPNFGNVEMGNPAYDAMYQKYSGILISGGPNGVLNSAAEQRRYLDPSGIIPPSSLKEGLYDNDDIWVYINKNEIMANFAPSGNVSRAVESGQNIQVNTGLNINFQFPGNPDFGNIEYLVKDIAFIYADQSKAYGFRVEIFSNVNYFLTSVNEDKINVGFTKEDLARNDTFDTDQLFVPVGRCNIYALIQANNRAKTGKPIFPQGCEPISTEDPQWALSDQNRWGTFLEQNTKANNQQVSYGIFYVPLDIESGSGNYTVTIPVSIAQAPSPI